MKNLIRIVSCALLVIGGIAIYRYMIQVPDAAPALTGPKPAKSLIKHLACIMDGNRRWAKKQGLVPWYGHKEGVESVRRVMEFCLEYQIPHLSLYTFSLENFQRSPQETKYLFELMVNQAQESIDQALKNNMRLRFVGDRSKFPDNLIHVLDSVEQQTKAGTALTVNFLFCYGGQQEIVQAAQQLALQAKKGLIEPAAITVADIKKHLWLNDVPDPEIVIRTGGVARLSNFLLFQAAYSELYFLSCLWPELTKADLEKVLMDFEAIKRNFGT